MHEIFYKYLFCFGIDVAITNSFILLLFTPNSMTLGQERIKAFCLQLAQQLVEKCTVIEYSPQLHIIPRYNRGTQVFNISLKMCIVKGKCFMKVLNTSGPCYWKLDPEHEVSIEPHGSKLARLSPCRLQGFEPPSSFLHSWPQGFKLPSLPHRVGHRGQGSKLHSLLGYWVTKIHTIFT